VATSRWVTDFSICESCCWGFIWSADGGRQQRARSEVRTLAARYAVEMEMLTFLGGRRAEPEPCEERTEDDSSVITCVDKLCCRRRCEDVSVIGPSERSRRCCLVSRGRCDGVDAGVGALHT
jgi:hypothetical protein